MARDRRRTRGYFDAAPVTKVIWLTTAVSSFGSTFLRGGGGVRNMFALSLTHIIQHKQVWRLFTSQVAFGSTTESFFGLCLIYCFRHFEHYLGSSKFAVCLTFLTLVSLLLQLLFLTFFQKYKETATGPYGIIFGLFVHFLLDIPQAHPFRWLGLSISFNKAITYLLGIQLMFSSGLMSMYTAATGVAAGLLYHMNFGGVKRLRYPVWLSQILQRILGPLLNPNLGRRPQRHNAGHGQIPAHVALAAAARNIPLAGVNANVAAVAAIDATTLNQLNFRQLGASSSSHQTRAPLSNPRRTVVADENLVTQLISMGFGEQRAKQALIATNNQLNTALDQLNVNQ